MKRMTLLLMTLAACGGGGGGGMAGDPSDAFTYYVDGGSGSDAAAGTAARPFKTITKAMSVATAGQSVKVLPGTYDAANGEAFPISIPDSVSLIGEESDKGATTVIQGGGAVVKGGLTFLAAILPGAHSVVAGFTVTDTMGGNSWPMGLALRKSSVELRNNRLVNSLSIAVYIIDGTTNHLIHDNLIQGNGSVGLAFIGGGVGSRVENNVITGNAYGVEYDSAGGDMGGGAAGSVGGNALYGNVHSDLWTNQTNAVTIYVANCTWDHVAPTVGAENSADIFNGGGAIIVTTGAQLAS